MQASPKELHEALEKTREAYRYIRSVPAPRRGEILRQVREALAAKVHAYMRLVLVLAPLLTISLVKNIRSEMSSARLSL